VLIEVQTHLAAKGIARPLIASLPVSSRIGDFMGLKLASKQNTSCATACSSRQQRFDAKNFCLK